MGDFSADFFYNCLVDNEAHDAQLSAESQNSESTKYKKRQGIAHHNVG
jgi:hypothetical protein